MFYKKYARRTSKRNTIVGSIYEQQQKRAREDPPYYRRASFNEGIGMVLLFRQSAPIATTPATKERGTSKEPPAKRKEVCCSRSKFFTLKII